MPGSSRKDRHPAGAVDTKALTSPLGQPSSRGGSGGAVVEMLGVVVLVMAWAALLERLLDLNCGGVGDIGGDIGRIVWCCAT